MISGLERILCRLAAQTHKVTPTDRGRPDGWCFDKPKVAKITSDLALWIKISSRALPSTQIELPANYGSKLELFSTRKLAIVTRCKKFQPEIKHSFHSWISAMKIDKGTF